jgi:hypothetical protein
MSLIELELIEELFSPAQTLQLIQQLKNAMVSIRNENDGRNPGDDKPAKAGGGI